MRVGFAPLHGCYASNVAMKSRSGVVGEMGNIGSEGCAVPSRRAMETISSIMLDPAIKRVMAGLVSATSLIVQRP
jgi:hypothetical protein